MTRISYFRGVHALYRYLCTTAFKRCHIATVFTLCVLLCILSLATLLNNSQDPYVMCYSKDPAEPENENDVDVFYDTEGAKIAVHNFYIDDRDYSQTILRGFAAPTESSVQKAPKTLYSLVWFSSDEPPSSTVCHLKHANIPELVLSRDFTHVIECSLPSEGGIAPSYVSITRELCGDPLTFLPVRAFEQMDSNLVDSFEPASVYT